MNCGNIWEILEKERISPDIKENNTDEPIDEVILEILVKRGLKSLDEIRKFLYGSIEDEYDPFLLKGMREAVERIRYAIDNGEIVLIHGDYDVDGVTATSLMGKVLSRFGVKNYLYLPERLKGGYGVSKKAIYFARDKGVKLVITVDCGISAYEEAELAKRFGIDLIITDHHRPSKEELPEAVSIIDPWQPGCKYPWKELSGVGIAYKFARALGFKPNEACLDLVAFGTVCDLSILLDENRILVKEGLKAIDSGKNFGLAALRRVAGVKGKKINTGHLGYMLGPRVNASGRLGSAECALKLLMTNNPSEAEGFAMVLDSENTERRKLEQIILKEAMRKVDQSVDFEKESVIVVWNKSWHLGVIGIVAQRLVERFHRPAIVISVDRETGVCRGSARSVKGINIFEALNATKDCLTEFGGHEYAAGIEIESENLESFRERINEYVKNMNIEFSNVKSFTVDAEINFYQISERLLRGLELMEPFGRSNPKPIFLTRGLRCKERSVFLSRSTVKLWLTDGEFTHEAVWFHAPVNTKILKGDKVDILYNLTRKRWRGQDVVTLELKDLKVVDMG